MKNVESVLSVKFNSTHSAEELMNVCQEDLETFRGVPGFFRNIISQKNLQGPSVGYIFFKPKAPGKNFGRQN